MPHVCGGLWRPEEGVGYPKAVSHLMQVLGPKLRSSGGAGSTAQSSP